eukprot:4168141-Amphidinium_carterae.1
MDKDSSAFGSNGKDRRNKTHPHPRRQNNQSRSCVCLGVWGVIKVLSLKAKKAFLSLVSTVWISTQHSRTLQAGHKLPGSSM